MDLAILFSAVAACGTVALAVLAFFQTKAAQRAAEASQAATEASQKMVDENRRMVEVNRATLEEMQADREERMRPRVRVDIDYDHQPWLYVVVRNLGGGAASSVHFDFRPELVTPASASPVGEGEIPLSQGLPMFTRSIDFLPAGAEILVWWGSAELIVGYFYEQKLERRGINIEIFYHSLDRQHFYEEQCNINPVDMYPALQFHPPSLSRLVNPVVNAVEKLEKAIDHHGYVKIKTATERNREARKRHEQMAQQAEEYGNEIERRREEHNEQIRKRLEQDEE